MIDPGLDRSEFRETFFEKQPLLRRSSKMPQIPNLDGLK